MKLKLLILFTIPFSLFSQIQIGSDIIGEDPVSQSGYTVDISHEGHIIAIGSPGNDGNGNDSGHVRIYKNVSSIWTQIGQDIDGEIQGEESGKGLSLANNGSIIAIGSPKNSTNGFSSGQVRVFENINNIWTQIGQNLNGINSNDNFGVRVKLSEDGNTLAVSYDYYKLKIFRNINNIWTQIGQELNDGYLSSTIGYHIDISSNGNIIAVGTQGFLNGNIGRVHVYQFVNNTWSQIGQVLNGSNQDDYFGAGLSISENGDILAVSAYFNDDNGSNSGQVKVFKNINNTWTQIGQNLNGEGDNDNYGIGVALSNNGTVLAIGSPNNDNNGNNSGHVKVFEFNGISWIQKGIDIVGNLGDQFGNSIALSNNGTKLVSGAFTAAPNTASGLTRVFDLSSILSVGNYDLVKFNLYPNPVKNILNLQLDSGLELKQLSIYNIQNQFIFSTKKQSIDISSFTSGFYFIEIQTNKGKSTKKIVIE